VQRLCILVAKIHKECISSKMQIPLKCINPRIALLFLRTPVALGGKKAPIPLSIRTTNMLDSKSQSGVFDHGKFKESVPK